MKKYNKRKSRGVGKGQSKKTPEQIMCEEFIRNSIKYGSKEDEQGKSKLIIHLIIFLFSVLIASVSIGIIVWMGISATNYCNDLYESVLDYGLVFSIISIVFIIVTLVFGFLFFINRNIFMNKKEGYIAQFALVLATLLIAAIGVIECRNCYQDIRYKDHVTYSGMCTGYGGGDNCIILHDGKRTSVKGDTFGNRECNATVVYAKRSKRCLYYSIEDTLQ